MGTDFRGQPGVYTGYSLNSRNIFVNRSQNKDQVVPSFLFIDGTYSRDAGNTPTDLLRAGLIMGKATGGGASGNLRPSIIGLTNGAYASGATSITVVAAVATEIARLITLAGTSISLKIIGPPSTAGTVAVTSCTCSAASGTTLTVADLGVAKATGSAIAPADGAQTVATVLPGPYPISVSDLSGTAINQPVQEYLRGADLIATQIVNLTEGDASVQAYYKAALKSAGVYTFDNDR